MQEDERTQTPLPATAAQEDPAGQWGQEALKDPSRLQGLPVRDPHGRQVGHVLSAHADQEGLTVHAHLSDRENPWVQEVLQGRVGRVSLGPLPPPWVHGRRADLRVP